MVESQNAPMNVIVASSGESLGVVSPLKLSWYLQEYAFEYAFECTLCQGRREGREKATREMRKVPYPFSSSVRVIESILGTKEQCVMLGPGISRTESLRVVLSCAVDVWNASVVPLLPRCASASSQTE